MIILSPAKKLRTDHVSKKLSTQPRMQKETEELIQIMKKKSSSDLQKLMGISVKLGDLNYERYQSWEENPNPQDTNPAILDFQGDVYQGLKAETMSDADLEYAQDHLRILSGLYGLLRPMDAMQDYRLEMGTSLKTKKGKNLYEFWGDKITHLLAEDIAVSGDKYLFNLASKEYTEALDMDKLGAEIINFGFKEWRNEKWMFISYNAKRARGMVSRYILDNKIIDEEGVKGFSEDGYTFNEELSEQNNVVFTR